MKTLKAVQKSKHMRPPDIQEPSPQVYFIIGKFGCSHRNEYQNKDS